MHHVQPPEQYALVPVYDVPVPGPCWIPVFPCSAAEDWLEGAADWLLLAGAQEDLAAHGR